MKGRKKSDTYVLLVRRIVSPMSELFYNVTYVSLDFSFIPVTLTGCVSCFVLTLRFPSIDTLYPSPYHMIPMILKIEIPSQHF